MRFDIHPFADVQAARQWARAGIDAAAGDARGRFITTAAGQEAAYRAKYDDACRFIAAGYPDDVDGFPWIAAEAARSGIAPRAAADRIKQRGDAWNLVVGPAIEGHRVAGKDALASLATVADVVRTARQVIDQLAQLQEGGPPAPV